MKPLSCDAVLLVRIVPQEALIYLDICYRCCEMLTVVCRQISEKVPNDGGTSLREGLCVKAERFRSAALDCFQAVRCGAYTGNKFLQLFADVP